MAEKLPPPQQQAHDVPLGGANPNFRVLGEEKTMDGRRIVLFVDESGEAKAIQQPDGTWKVSRPRESVAAGLTRRGLIAGVLGWLGWNKIKSMAGKGEKKEGEELKGPGNSSGVLNLPPLKHENGKADPKEKRDGDRVLEYPVHPEAQAIIDGLRSKEKLVKINGFEVRESVAKGINLANEFLRRDGSPYQIRVNSGKDELGGHRDRKKFWKGKWGDIGGSMHSDGAAVDVYLYRIDDPKKKHVTWMSGHRPGEEVTDEQLAANKEILKRYMNAAGFVRLDFESWHYEMGSKGPDGLPGWAAIMKKYGYLKSTAGKIYDSIF